MRSSIIVATVTVLILAACSQVPRQFANGTKTTRAVTRTLQPGLWTIDSKALARQIGDVAADRRRKPESGVGLSVPVPVRISAATLREGGRSKWPEIRRKCRLATDGARVGDDARAPEGLADWLRAKGIELLSVSYGDAMALGANVMALGEDRVISTAAARGLNERLRALGLTVYDPDLWPFTMGGGGPHCLAQPMRREPA